MIYLQIINFFNPKNVVMKIHNFFKTVLVLGLCSWFNTAQAQNEGEISGGTFGDSHDIFIVNADESYYDAGIRLQTRAGGNGGVFSDWNIFANREDQKLHFSFWSSHLLGSHSQRNDSNENDIGNTRMTLQSNGFLGLGTKSPTHILHVKTANAVGLLESTTNTAYLRLSTNEGLGNRVEYTNRAGGRASIWVAGAGVGDAFNVLKNGNVGVGTIAPTRKLQVEGSFQLNGDLHLANDRDMHGLDLLVGYNDLRLLGGPSTATAHLYITTQGRVGIGNTVPTEILDVTGNVKASGSLTAASATINGTVTADRVVLNVGSFPDYVFADDYKLMSLKEVSAYIKTHKHLPNVPSEAEVVAKGMSVGQINTVLMEKIEELTLHTINQEEKMERQQATIDMLIKELTELKAAVAPSKK